MWLPSLFTWLLPFLITDTDPVLMHPVPYAADTAISAPSGLSTYFHQVVNDPEASMGITKGRLGYSQKGNPVDVWYFPGTSNHRALIIGGMHGSELSSIRLAENLISYLQQGARPYFSVMIIPSLFPDNAAAAMADADELGSVKNKGRYTNAKTVDPNRQMPPPGQAFNPKHGIDYHGRQIEPENQFLLSLIQLYKPSRVLNIHAIRNKEKTGIYADPRTDEKGIALGFETDSLLAISMAWTAKAAGADVHGNNLFNKPNAVYYCDPRAVAKGCKQERNTSVNSLKSKGISLGTWASTAVLSNWDSTLNRPALTTLTLELPGSKRPEDYKEETQRTHSFLNIRAMEIAILEIFLSDRYVEEWETTFCNNHNPI